MSGRLALAFAALLACASGCRAFGPPGQELVPLLEPAAAARGALRKTAWSRIESRWFSGEFRTLVVQGEQPTRIRLQLLPDLGGKVLDLVVTPAETAGYWPHTGASFRERYGRDLPAPPRGLIGFLAVSLLENATPLGFDRVRGMRRCDGGYALELEPAIEGDHTHIEVRIAADGALESRHYTHRGVSWREVFEPEHRFEAQDFDWVLSEETTQALAAPPDSLFELELPPGREP